MDKTQKTNEKEIKRMVNKLNGLERLLERGYQSIQIRYCLLRESLIQGIRRIGVYPTFIHIDANPYLPQDVCW